MKPKTVLLTEDHYNRMALLKGKGCHRSMTRHVEMALEIYLRALEREYRQRELTKEIDLSKARLGGE